MDATRWHFLRRKSFSVFHPILPIYSETIRMLDISSYISSRLYRRKKKEKKKALPFSQKGGLFGYRWNIFHIWKNNVVISPVPSLPPLLSLLRIFIGLFYKSPFTRRLLWLELQVPYLRSSSAVVVARRWPAIRAYLRRHLDYDFHPSLNNLLWSITVGTLWGLKTPKCKNKQVAHV